MTYIVFEDKLRPVKGLREIQEGKHQGQLEATLFYPENRKVFINKNQVREY